MKQTYHLPVMVEIEADRPDTVMRRIAETIYDALDEFMAASEFSERCRRATVDYSVYIKADQETFGQE